MIAKKTTAKPPLSMVEIVMRSDVATIEAALEARRKIDALLAERAAAYERIAALEKQIDEVMGVPDEFIFPPPPFPVAPFAASTAQTTPVAKSAPAPAAAAKAEVHDSGTADEPAVHNGSASAHSPEGSSRRTGSTRSAAAQN